MAIDLILNQAHTPTLEEVGGYMDEEGRALWGEFNSFVTNRYNTVPKPEYSKCSGKPGWNIKYRKSGKSLCTVYPEKNGFIVLVVILLDMAPIIMTSRDEYSERIIELVDTAQPYNGTKWLMVPVSDRKNLDGVKKLLLMKYGGLA